MADITSKIFVYRENVARLMAIILKISISKPALNATIKK